jgi:thiol-disulfide isomerase/thioredoxin
MMIGVPRANQPLARPGRALVVLGLFALGAVGVAEPPALPSAPTPPAPLGEGPAAVGTPAPEWELRDPQDRLHRSAESVSAGHVVFLDFVATWCAPCVEARPATRGLHERFASRGVDFYSVHCRDEGDPRELFGGSETRWPLLLRGDAVADRFAVPTLLTFIVVDAAGRIAYRGYGYAPGAETKLAAAIERALGASPTPAPAPAPPAAPPPAPAGKAAAAADPAGR